MNQSASAVRRDLLDDHSIEITAKDTSAITEAAPHLTRGTAVNVTFLGSEDAEDRREACRVVRHHGLRPVPHLSARRITSEAELTGLLSGLEADGATEEVFVVGGDPATPHGPFDDALALIKTGLLREHGVRRVGISGYPEGHPHIDDTKLWSALEDKLAALADDGFGASITTQFGFDAAAVTGWIESVRGRGITVPIRVGIPGPAGIRRLLGYARRFGVGSSAGIVGKYGISLTNLMGTAGPDRFVDELAGRLGDDHGAVKVHFYTFGGVEATASWVTSRKQARR